MLNRIFVYGTLKKGYENYSYLAPFVEAVQPGRCTGLLYEMEGCDYPAMVGGKGWVQGEIVTIKPSRLHEGLAVLDRLEEYYGPGNEKNVYERVIRLVEEANGSLEPAYLYLWVGMEQLAATGQLLAEGCWNRGCKE